jgi:hypothetical protein
MRACTMFAAARLCAQLSLVRHTALCHAPTAWEAKPWPVSCHPSAVRAPVCASPPPP